MTPHRTLCLLIFIMALLMSGSLSACGRHTAAHHTPSPPPHETDPDEVDVSQWHIDNRYPDEIRMRFPLAGDEITSPLIVRGEARGMWFFEATLSLVLVDWNGLIIAEWYAEATGDWMTTAFVPFEGTLRFDAPTYIGPWSRRGALIVKNANPKGWPEFDKAIEIPVVFGHTRRAD